MTLFFRLTINFLYCVVKKKCDKNSRTNLLEYMTKEKKRALNKVAQLSLLLNAILNTQKKK